MIDGEFVNLAEVVNSIHFGAILPKRNRYKFEEKWEMLFTKIGYALKQNERGGKDIKHNSKAVGGINMSAWVDTLPKRQSQFGLSLPLEAAFELCYETVSYKGMVNASFAHLLFLFRQIWVHFISQG